MNWKYLITLPIAGLLMTGCYTTFQTLQVDRDSWQQEEAVVYYRWAPAPYYPPDFGHYEYWYYDDYYGYYPPYYYHNPPCWYPPYWCPPPYIGYPGWDYPHPYYPPVVIYDPVYVVESPKYLKRRDFPKRGTEIVNRDRDNTRPGSAGRQTVIANSPEREKGRRPGVIGGRQQEISSP